MPEGDSLFRAARTLHAALVSRVVSAFASTVPEAAVASRQHRLVGRRVERVESRGKHLLMRFEGGLVLHTHLGMTGSWHLYRVGSPWRLGRHLARAVVEAGDRVAVCFQAPTVEIPTVEILLPGAEAGHGGLSRLGPDVLAPEPDVEAACAGLRGGGDREIGVALLDQHALAGIGNIFKSEALFLQRLSPRRSVATLSDPELAALVRAAAALMKRSAGAGTRRHTPFAAEPCWVYGRAGRPCRRCGTRIIRLDQGRPSRSTYVCPTCQGEAVTPAPESRPSSSPPRKRS
jgi:endonuclease VIII